MWNKRNGLNKTEQDFLEFITNYLDDFLFVSESINKCNRMTQSFIAMCDTIGVPISEEKTEWGSVRIIFLGILLDGNKLILTIPEENGSEQSEC